LIPSKFQSTSIKEYLNEQSNSSTPSDEKMSSHQDLPEKVSDPSEKISDSSSQSFKKQNLDKRESSNNLTQIITQIVMPENQSNMEGYDQHSFDAHEDNENKL